MDTENKFNQAFHNVLSWGAVNPLEFPGANIPKHDLPCNCQGAGPGIPGRSCGWGKCGPGPKVPTMRGIGVGTSY